MARVWTSIYTVPSPAHSYVESDHSLQQHSFLLRMCPPYPAGKIRHVAPFILSNQMLMQLC